MKRQFAPFFLSFFIVISLRANPTNLTNTSEPQNGDGVLVQIHESSTFQVVKNFAEALAFRAKNMLHGTTAFNFDAYKIDKKPLPSLALQSHDALRALDLAEFSKEFFPYYVLISTATPSAAPWKELLVALVKGDRELLAHLLKRVPTEELDRAYRLLSYSNDSSLLSLAQVKAAKQNCEALANQPIRFSPLLSGKEDTKLFNMLIMLSIRAPKKQMVASKIKQLLGLGDGKVRPMIRRGNPDDVIQNEARLAALKFNQRVESNPELKADAFESLLNELFALYLTRYNEPREEPWFYDDGHVSTMNEFMTRFLFVKPEFKEEEFWMEVSNLRASTVFNPFIKSKGLARQMWWNRLAGYHPLGNTRVSRNYDATKSGVAEQTESIEVLHQGKDGIYVPYLFERKNDKLAMVSGPKSREIMMSCFGCHLRLTELFTGGINMKDYKPSPDWLINDFDMLMPDHHHSLIAHTTGEAVCTVESADLRDPSTPSAIRIRLSCNDALFEILKPGQPLKIQSKIKAFDQWLAPYRVDSKNKLIEFLYDSRAQTTAAQMRELNWGLRRLKAEVKRFFGIGKKLTVQVQRSSPYHATFNDKLPHTVVFIGAGTGVTPNFAIWDSLTNSLAKRAWLQIAPEESRFFFRSEIQKSARDQDTHRYFDTGTFGRPILGVELAQWDLEDNVVFACGPKPLLREISGIVKRARVVTCF